MPEISSKPRIALGSDHASYPIQETIRQFLLNAGYPVERATNLNQQNYPASLPRATI